MPKDTHSTLPADAKLVLPEQVTLALAELAGAAHEGLLALAVGTGLGCWAACWTPDLGRAQGLAGQQPNPDHGRTPPPSPRLLPAALASPTAGHCGAPQLTVAVR